MGDHSAKLALDEEGEAGLVAQDESSEEPGSSEVAAAGLTVSVLQVTPPMANEVGSNPGECDAGRRPSSAQ